MFWLDATVKNGVIHLFGKVSHNDKVASCCATVKNNQHNLFVLPRANDDFKVVYDAK
jgi:hypothetical protein